MGFAAASSAGTQNDSRRSTPKNFLHGIPAGFCLLALLGAAILGASSPAQQTTLKRYDIYTGFTDLNSPALGLNQKGFHTQTGVNLRSWYVLGLDYSVSSGSTVLKPDLLPIALQQQLQPILVQFIQAGVIPPTYQLALPAHVLTQSIAGGPQFSNRHFRLVTLFVRPSFGAFRLAATPHPADPVATVISHALVPSGHKVDWTGFYGFGGGDEVMFTNTVGLRTQLDVVYNHPFNDLLANGFWTMRYSAGLNFHFGRNILAAPAK